MRRRHEAFWVESNFSNLFWKIEALIDEVISNLFDENKFQIVLVNEAGEELDSYFSSFVPQENSVICIDTSDNIGLYHSRWLIVSPPEIEIEKNKVQRVMFRVTGA